MKKKGILITCLISLMILTSCGKKDDVRETVTGEGESTSVSELETDEPGYTVEIGKDWRYAYSDTEYDFYYMNMSSEVYDSNVILSITSDKTLGGEDPSKVCSELSKYYGDDAMVELKKTGSKEYVYAKVSNETEGLPSYVGLYVLIGEKEAVVISVYSVESKFELASENAEEVVSTIVFK